MILNFISLVLCNQRCLCEVVFPAQQWSEHTSCEAVLHLPPKPQPAGFGVGLQGLWPRRWCWTLGLSTRSARSGA